MPSFANRLAASLVLAATTFAATASPLERIRLFAVTESHQLIVVSAAEPGKIARSVKLVGLAADERILGIDYRVAYGTLYALGSSGRMFTVDTETGALSPVGSERFAIALDGAHFGFDFNPAADRIRIVSGRGQNLRAHPETGALVDFKPDQDGLQPDGALAYDAGDPRHGHAADIVAAGYTYNTENEKLTTNYAIDRAAGTLARQGALEGTEPAVSPNSGQLRTVGSLGVRAIVDAHFDIADVTNTALAALATRDQPAPTLYRIDLASGRAAAIGKIGEGEALRGLAIEP
ncbi:MAG: DUF4394 domain-containing protein [Thauera sp.]|jgi:hypothetical protein